MINKCYITNQKEYYVIPKGLDKENTLFFPEHNMSLHELMTTGRPDGYNIITDCPYLVSLYERTEVFIWNKETKEWNNPDFNTYGASYELIKSIIWGFDNSIPQAIIDGNITNIMGHKIKTK